VIDDQPEESKMDASKYVSAGLAAIGAIALAASGYLTVTTPEAQECAVQLADHKARLELLTEAKDACKVALSSCVGADEGDMP
jgi:predicted aconitase